MTYESPAAGEPVAPVMRGYRMACCDCGLVHRIDFKVVEMTEVRADGWNAKRPANATKLRVVMRVHRDERATRRQRRA